MARTICLQPCLPGGVIAGFKMTIPLMGTTISPQGSLSFDGGCSGCDFAGDLLSKINGFLNGFGIPLCLLGCLGAVVEFAKAVPDSLGPPPDPSKLITATTNVVAKCECVLGMALPPPAGAVCDFLKFVRDMVGLVYEIVSCLTGLVNHLATLNIRAALMLGDTSQPVIVAGQCLAGQIQQMMDALNGKLGGLGSLFAAITPIFNLLNSIGMPAPFSSVIATLQAGFATFSGAIPPGTTPGAFLTALQSFSSVLQTAYTSLQTIAAVCP